jgi:hypothetical protein
MGGLGDFGVLDDGATQALLSQLDWDASRDGNVIAVRGSLGGGSGGGNGGDISVLAGFAGGDPRSNQSALLQVVGADAAEARRQHAGLDKFLMTVRNDLRRRKDVTVSRFAFLHNKGGAVLQLTEGFDPRGSAPG